MSQEKMILEYLKTHRNTGISQAEAINLFGCYRLSARIANLRAAGWQIDMDREPTVNRFGDKARYGRYRLRGKAK